MLIIAGVMGVTMNPGILAATDTVQVAGLDTTNAVETVPVPEPEPEPELRLEPTPLAPIAGALSAPQAINYTVTIASGEIVGGNLSYGDIYKTGRLVYGHNSMALMGNLPSLGVGTVFTVTEGGVATTYQVADVVIYEKNVELGTLQRGGQGNYMRAVLNAYNKDTGAQYGLALMTCYGQPLGGGDATHRYVVYANAI